MEEYDDLIQRPDDAGLLDLSHRAFSHLDDGLYEFGQSLLYLNCAYNNVAMLSPQFGQLVQLREFDLSCNQLESLPREIGRCIRLKKLKLNGNKLTTLPEELSGCKTLEELILSENQLKDIPASIGQLDLLTVLQLQGNDLRELPPELGDCMSLETVDVSLNPGLIEIPDKLKSDGKLISWLCQKAKAHRSRMEEMEDITAEMEELARNNDQEKIKLSDDIKSLQKKVNELEAERPYKYLAYKYRAVELKSRACIVM
jgi:leucine-rich repeat protein SHOC2